MLCGIIIKHTHTQHTKIHRGRYEINTFMQMLSLWLASFMQITRLQSFVVRISAYGYRLASILCAVRPAKCAVPSQSYHFTVSMKHDRRTI